MEQLLYDQFLDTTINPKTKDWYQQRDRNRNIIKGTGGHYVVSVITRVRTADKSEHLLSKGYCKGFNAGGSEVRLWTVYRERHTKTLFDHKEKYDEKSESFTTYNLGPRGTETVYDLPFNQENVDYLWNLSNKKDVIFVLKLEDTGDAKDVNWSSKQECLSLMKNKPFDYLWKADYMPQDVKNENRIEAEGRGWTAKSNYPTKEGKDSNQGYLA